MTPREWTIELPYQTPVLSLNKRVHWALHNRLTGQLRQDAYYLAAHAKLPQQLERVRVVLHWQPAMRRRRDNVNINPTLKPLVDGLVDYGLTPDDDYEHVVTDTVIECVGPLPRLWLTITDLSVPVGVGREPQ